MFMSILHVISILQVHVYAPCSCPCYMSISMLGCMSISLLRVHVHAVTSMPMLHVKNLQVERPPVLERHVLDGAPQKRDMEERN
jgi:hypothetical protein